MLFSLHQRYILELLRKTGCLRQEHIYVLIRESFREDDFEISRERVDAMLSQLRTGGDLRLDGELAILPPAEPDPLLLEAVDVMLELSGGRQHDFKVGLHPPELLRFAYGEERIKALTVAALTSSGDAAAEVERLQTQRVVWINSGGLPFDSLLLPLNHFYASRNEDGSHRFYGGVDE